MFSAHRDPTVLLCPEALLATLAQLAMSPHGQEHLHLLLAGRAEEPGLLGAGGLAGLQQRQPMAMGVERGRNWVSEGLVEGVQPLLEQELGRKALARVPVCGAGRSLPGGLSQGQCGWKQVSVLRLMWPLQSHTGFYSSTIVFPHLEIPVCVIPAPTAQRHLLLQKVWV